MFDVLAYLDSIGIGSEYKSQRKYLYIACPECDSGEPHLWINVGDLTRPHACWGCWKDPNHGGGPKKLIRHLENVGWQEAEVRLMRFNTLAREISLDACVPSTEAWDKDFDPPEIKKPSRLYSSLESRSAMAYLRNKGFTEQEVIDWDLYYADYWKHGNRKYKWRLFIPIYFQDKLVAFQACDVTGRQREKYLNPPDSPIKNVVYNVDRVDPELVVITEGVTDAWAVGKDHGVCIFGKEISGHQAKALYEVVGARKVLVALDGDAYGEAEGIAHDLVGVVPKVDVLEMPYGEDPASLGRGSLWKLIEKTQHFS